MRLIVPDVNVILRPLYKQPDYEKAEELLKEAAFGRVQLIVPNLFFNEFKTALLSIPRMTRMEYKQRHNQLNSLVSSGILNVAERSMPVIMRGYDIGTLPKLPSNKKLDFLDAQYHALAIENSGEFVTADYSYINAIAGRVKSVVGLRDLEL